MAAIIKRTIGGAIIEGVGGVWCPQEDYPCRVVGKSDEEALFSEAQMESYPFHTGVGDGTRHVFSRFKGFPSLKVETRVWIEASTGDVRYDLIPLCDDEIKEIYWPAPFQHESREGKTVLPVMQGCLLDNYDPRGMKMRGGHIACSRGMTMRFYAQYDQRGGYTALVDTFYDGGLSVSAEPDQCVSVSPMWMAQLGKIGEERSMRLRMMAPGCDYNDAASIYRGYIRALGELKTLREKIAAAPKVEEYIATPICHTQSYIHISPTSAYYDAEHPEKNEELTTFAEVEAKLRRLHDLGVERLCLHLDGWQKNGYDSLHPDALPPCQAAGGWEGLAKLRKTCHELGYFFGVHDQYRDYYYDCESFDLENVARRVDGTYEDIAFWYGGRQTVLCGKVARDYVRRNYNEMEKNDAKPDNAYLDVFSVVELDECSNPAHQMTREACAMARARCFSDVAARGIVVQSEEIVDWAAPYIAFVHHAPFALDQDWTEGQAFGRRIPLQHLVYHDCVIMPFFAQKGGFGVPDDVDGALLSLLYGCGTYISETAEEGDVARMRKILDWQKKVQLRPMIRHAFLEGDKERCEFEGGFISEVDFATGEYILTEGK